MTHQQPNHPLIELPLAQFLDALAAGTPAPGGGAATGLAAALGAALAGMVARLTLDRPRYAAYADEMQAAAARADALRGRLASLIDTDAAAFERLSAARRLPKDTPSEAAMRAEAVEAALWAAIDAPLALMGTCADVLALLTTLAAHGNRNAIEDAAVGALLAHAALAGAGRNARANLRDMGDDPQNAVTARATTARINELLTAGETSLHTVLAAADARG